MILFSQGKIYISRYTTILANEVEEQTLLRAYSSKSKSKVKDLAYCKGESTPWPASTSIVMRVTSLLPTDILRFASKVGCK